MDPCSFRQAANRFYKVSYEYDHYFQFFTFFIISIQSVVWEAWNFVAGRSFSIAGAGRRSERGEWGGVRNYLWILTYFVAIMIITRKRMDIHREELMKKVFHPRRLSGPIWPQRGPSMLVLKINFKFIDGWSCSLYMKLPVHLLEISKTSYDLLIVQ